MTTIKISKTTQGWQAVFFGSTTMPNGQALPLPFTAQADAAMVASNMLKRFPGSVVRASVR